VPTLPLSPDELLTTTRAVRKRLDLSRPVDRELLLECLAMAQQAPSGSNRQGWRFLVVTEARTRAALAELYRRGAESYFARRTPNPNADAAQQERLLDSAGYLVEHLQRVPVHVIPCILGRPEGQPLAAQAGLWGSILPATWSFMLAARARGLGTAWTTFHLAHEDEAAELLGIPAREVTQAALIPVAHYLGEDFRPGPRRPLDDLVRWERWEP
jgi:nitroreductase